MHLDIIIYAIIAIVLFSRLWSIFGQRDDGSDAPPGVNPFAGKKDAPSMATALPAPSPVVRAASAPESLMGALDQIHQMDPTFDEKSFLQGARAAFVMIVEDFGRGELGRATPFLGPDVLANFQKSLSDRRQQGHVVECKVARVREADTVAVRLDGTNAFVTVRFVSEQENVSRDSEGRVVSGETGHLEEITDQWIFSRDVRSNDPNWRLVETIVLD
jgi:predicted lipid-binding transport protein (Tim44 family)